MVLLPEPRPVPATRDAPATRAKASRRMGKDQAKGAGPAIPSRPDATRAAPGTPPAIEPADHATRSAALRRIAAQVSGSQDVERLFAEVIDASFALFGVDRAGLWTYENGPKPLSLAAQRGLSPEMLVVIANLLRDASTAGMAAVRERRVAVLSGDLSGTLPVLRAMYEQDGIRTVCFVPIVFRDQPLGLLVLYHGMAYPWSTDETDLARALGDHIAIAMQNARLAESTRALAERLGAISDLAGRLNRIQDMEGIAQAIVAEAGRLLEYDTIRVYRVDATTGMCEPIAFNGTFYGVTDPDPASLRIRIGQGLTGWVAAKHRALRLADATADPRSIPMGSTDGPESMLLVPMM